MTILRFVWNSDAASHMVPHGVEKRLVTKTAVGGIVRLRQADANRFVLQKDVDAFITLLPGCSAIRLHSCLCNGLYDTLAETVSAVPVGELDCLPDEGAALLCEESLTKEYEYLYNH